MTPSIKVVLQSLALSCFLSFSFESNATAPCHYSSSGTNIPITLKLSDVTAVAGSTLSSPAEQEITICRFFGNEAEIGSSLTPALGATILLGDQPWGWSGFQEVIPGLSVNIVGMTTRLKPADATVWEYKPTYAGGSGHNFSFLPESYKQTTTPIIATFALRMDLRRDATPLAAGDYIVPLMYWGGVGNVQAFTVNLLVRVPHLTCKVAVPNQTVQLTTQNTVALNKLAIGAASQENGKFTIALNCPQALQSMQISFHDNHDSSSVEYFRLYHSTADGVAIQVETADKNIPIRPGTSVPFPTPDKAGTTSMDFTTRYIKTKHPVIPGDARAAAAFTITYD
jgi:type 1 fimbria pilin